MDWFSGFGPPTYPPSRHELFMTVAIWVFVPFTAAGQRGILTPLPHIHLHVFELLDSPLTKVGFFVKS